jgi:hypothetical protein
MPASKIRQEARARILAVFTAQLDQLIPEDEEAPLKGATFADFEDRVKTLAQAALPVALEERAGLEPNAEVETAGRCPHCGSQGMYLKKEVTQPEIRSRYGPVVLSEEALPKRCHGARLGREVNLLGSAPHHSADVSAKGDVDRIAHPRGDLEGLAGLQFAHGFVVTRIAVALGLATHGRVEGEATNDQPVQADALHHLPGRVFVEQRPERPMLRANGRRSSPSPAARAVPQG